MARAMALVGALLLASCSYIVGVAAQAGQQNVTSNQTLPVAAPFLSRPDLTSIVLNITLKKTDQVSPGYIFLAPYQIAQSGPYLFDNDGNLVWSGYGQAGPSNSHDFSICPYNGSDHICLYQGAQLLGYSRGHGTILDSAYNVVKTIQSGNGLPPSDQHEFNMVDNGTSSLITIYQPLQADLTAYNITGGQGWIMNGLFQEIDVASGAVKFQWSAADHVDLSAGYVLPNTSDVSGDGKTKDTPWDYFHINAVDKNADGDYLVSSRHTETVYKVSGMNGSILWQLGGKASTFTQNGYNFSYQHNCRFIASNASTTVFSMFDNAWNGFNGSSDTSSGKIISINHANNSSSLLQSFSAPGGLTSASQGNLQLLPNGNAFIGWGSHAYVSESAPDGTPVFYAHFATTGALHYRAFRFNFTSTPTTSPALFAFAQNATAPTAFYMSWNGATEVASWTLYGGSTPDNLIKLGNVKKAGFETVAVGGTSVYAFTLVAAVANNGTALRNSTVTKTFIPGAELASSCNAIQCPLIAPAGGSPVFLQPMIASLTDAPIPPTPTSMAPTATSKGAAVPTGGMGLAGMGMLFAGGMVAVL